MDQIKSSPVPVSKSLLLMSLLVPGSFSAIQGQEMTNALARAQVLLGQFFYFFLDFVFGTTHQHHPINRAIFELGKPVFGFISALTHHIREHALEEWVVFEPPFAQLTRRKLLEQALEVQNENAFTYLGHASDRKRYVNLGQAHIVGWSFCPRDIMMSWEGVVYGRNHATRQVYQVSNYARFT